MINYHPFTKEIQLMLPCGLHLQEKQNMIYADCSLANAKANLK